MLELIHDNRTGQRMEIILPTLNEESRAMRLVSHYASQFDVVLLDDGSTDETVALAIKAGGTVFHRTVKDVVAEAHFAYYVAEQTRSGFCFWMFADEFVPRERMGEIEAALRGGAGGVLCRRVNYFCTREVKTLTSVSPRGFRRGLASYQAEDLHGGVHFKSLSGSPLASEIFEVHHFHLWSTRSYYGTAGSYAFSEVKQFLQSRHPHRRFLRRYVVSLGAYLLLKWWREKNLGVAARLLIAGDRLVIFVLAAMSWLEQKHMPSIAKQQIFYDSFFADDVAADCGLKKSNETQIDVHLKQELGT